MVGKFDPMKSVKLKLSGILHAEKDYSKLFSCIRLVNEIVHVGQLFMRSFIIDQINNKKKVIINKEFIGVVFKTIIDGTNEEKLKGRPLNETQNKIFSKLKLYWEKFSKKLSITNIQANNISYILSQESNKIYVSIINNLKYHYEDHLKRYTYKYFQKKYDTFTKDYNNIELYKKNFNKIIDCIMDKSIKNNLFCEDINEIRKILPEKFNIETFEKDINMDTFEYVKSSYFMNKFIEEEGGSAYQFFPIRKNSYQKFVVINTPALIDIFVEDNKSKALKNAGVVEFQKSIWNDCFKLKENDKDIIRYKGYSFNYEIQTDGYTIVLNMINDENISKKEEKKTIMRKGREESNKMKSELSKKKYEEYKNKKKENRFNKIITTSKKNKEEEKKKKEEFKKMSEEEQMNIKYKMALKKSFPLMDTLMKNNTYKQYFKDNYNKNNIIFCDPGKRSIMYLMKPNTTKTATKMDKNEMNNFGIHVKNSNLFMNYTNRTRLFFTKRLKYNHKIEQLKLKKFDGNNIKNMEKKLSKFSGNSCDPKIFMKYNQYKIYLPKKLFIL